MRNWLHPFVLLLAALGAAPTHADCGVGPHNPIDRLFGVAVPSSHYAAEGRPVEAAWSLADSGQGDEARKLLGQVEAQLVTGEVVGPLVPVQPGSSEVYSVTLANGLRGIFKPDPQYWRVKSVERTGQNANSRHEIAAYRTDKLLGTFVVPPTVERTIQGMTGSLQYFVQESGSARDGVNNLPSMWLLDFLIHNRDRHPANWLVYDHRAVGIDHGLSFVRNGPGHYYHGKPREPETYQNPALYDSFRKVSDEDLRATLRDFLPPDLIDDVIRRKNEVQADMARALRPQGNELQ